MVFLISCVSVFYQVFCRTFGLSNLLRQFCTFALMVVCAAATAAPVLPDEVVLAIRTAIQTHPDVMGADSKMLSAQTQVVAGGYRWFPKAEVAVKAGKSGDRYSTIGLNQTLWDGGKLNAGFDSAKATESAALFDKDVSMESVGMAAALVYIEVAKARHQKQVADDNVSEHEKLYESVQRRRDGGIGARSDVTLASSRLRQARATAEHWQGEVSRSEAAYLSVVGTSPVEGSLPLINLWDIANGKEGVVARVVARAPSLQKIREEVKVAELDVASKKAQLFPTLYARVENIQYFGNSAINDDTRFSVNFQWQNDVALTQRYQVDAAQYMVMAAQRLLESEERKLKNSASDYWDDYATSLSRREELGRFLISASETVLLFKRQFTIGRRSWPEVMNSLQDLYSARSQKVDAMYGAMSARMKLAFVAGEMDFLLGSHLQAEGQGGKIDLPGGLHD